MTSRAISRTSSPFPSAITMRRRSCKTLKGAGVPQGWQGALPFRYHLGDSGVKVHLVSQQDYQRRNIWDVIGKAKGAEYPDEWVVAGNHRDAWVYGAVDPSSGTAAMLEAVHGIGAAAEAGWRPKRTIVFCNWDAEEEGLIGSTEWVEQHAKTLERAVAYFNMDVGVSGPDFSASAVPSLKQFIRELSHSVPSPQGGTVFQQWKAHPNGENEHRTSNAPPLTGEDVHGGDLGSGSDFTPFLQHVGVPSTDVGSGGPYGVYHSVFDNYAWFTQNADPKFVYLQEMARRVWPGGVAHGRQRRVALRLRDLREGDRFLYRGRQTEGRGRKAEPARFWTGTGCGGPA